MAKEVLRDITNKKTNTNHDHIMAIKLQEQLTKLHSFKDTIQNDLERGQDIIKRTKAVYGDDVSDAPGYDDLLAADKKCKNTIEELQARIDLIQQQLDTLTKAEEPTLKSIPMNY